MDSDDLRQRAEKIIQDDTLSNNNKVGEVSNLLHELQVYQIELELQNAELRAAQLKNQQLQRRYYTLYHFAPVGYVAVDKDGVITEANLRACEMLGRERKYVLGKPIMNYMMSDSLSDFLDVFDQAFKTPAIQELEVQLRKWIDGNSTPIHTKIHAQMLESEADVQTCLLTLTDISARVAAEQDLIKSEMRFRRAVMDAPQPLILHDAKGEIVLISRLWTDVTGYTLHTMPTVDALLSKLQYPITRHNPTEPDWILDGEIQQEYILKTQLGDELVWVFNHTNLGDLPDGQQISMTIATDITRRKQQERQLAQYNYELETLRGISLAIGSTLNLDDILNHFLNHIQVLVPYHSAQVILKTDTGFEDLKQIVDDLIDPSYLLDTSIFETTLHYEQLKTNLRVIILSDASQAKAWLTTQTTYGLNSWMLIPLVTQGELRGVIALGHLDRNFYTPHHHNLGEAAAQQIASAIANARVYEQIEATVAQRTQELQDNEQQLRAILESIPDTVLRVDPAGIILDAYVQATDDWLTVAQDIIDKSLVEVFSPDLIPWLTWAVEQVLQRATMLTHETQHTSTQLGNQDYEYRVLKATNHDVVIMIRNISLEKRLAQQKDRFIANAAHELRTPITILTTKSYLMQRQPEKMEKHLDAMQAVINHITRIVEDLLDISRINRRNMQFDFQEVDLVALSQQVLSYFRDYNSVKERGLVLSLDAPTEYHHRLDRNRIIQVLLNLLDNAVTYTNSGSVTVRLKPNGKQVQLNVEDTGGGIPQEYLKEIFEPFNRAHRQSTEKGTGLGLAITKEIIEAHGGEIGVTSILGQGTTFTIHLPIYDTDSLRS